jgi:glycosyltransferase involved in cell wall biosynthesis
MSNSICIISLSTVRNDGRVLRQVRYLSQYYRLYVIGFGSAHPSWTDLPNLHWNSVSSSKLPTPIVLAMLMLGKIFPLAYGWWFWSKEHHVQALRLAQASECDVIYANEWDGLYIAASVARQKHIPVIYDAHEYSIGQYQNAGILKKWLMTPAICHLLVKSAAVVSNSVTVSAPIARELHSEFNLDPIVVLNAPEKAVASPHRVDPTHIRLIHHGIAQRNRHLETMIEAIALCDERYSLDMMLVDHDPGYLNELNKLASRLAYGRVNFRDPVPTEEIVAFISNYDVGIYILQPTSDNQRWALPNKLFEFIMAELAVCIGPSPAMSEIVNQYRCGCIAPSFDAQDVAGMLNSLTVDQIMEMRRSSHEASLELNAENESKKIVALVDRLLNVRNIA